MLDFPDCQLDKGICLVHQPCRLLEVADAEHLDMNVSGKVLTLRGLLGKK